MTLLSDGLMESTHICLIDGDEFDWVVSWRLKGTSVTESVHVPYHCAAVLSLVLMSRILTSVPVTRKLHAELVARQVTARSWPRSVASRTSDVSPRLYPLPLTVNRHAVMTPRLLIVTRRVDDTKEA